MIKKFMLTLIALLWTVLPLSANAIVPRLFSEILLDSTNWKIELDINAYGMDVQLDSCYLFANWGNARIKNCQLIDNRFYVITPDSLESPLAIFPAGDALKIESLSGVRLDNFSFGSAALNIRPLPGESICITNFYYYLDETPTIGKENDLLNAMGTIQGSITDSSGAPLTGISTFWSYDIFPDYNLMLDNAGKFSLPVVASRIVIFINDGENWESFKYYVYPESTVTVQIIFERTNTAVENDPVNLADGYKLANNYPNPFNSSTVIQYKIPKDDFV